MSGLGVNVQRLKVETSYSTKLIAILRTDTVNSAGLSGITECDIYETVGEYQEVDPSLTMLQLDLPVMFQFDIVQKHWSVGAGAKLAAPVHIAQKRLVTIRTIHLNENNQTVCTNEYKVVKDKSGDGISRANMSLAADMEYWFSRLGFGLGVEKQVTNLLENNFYDHYTNERTRKALPLTSYLRAMYRF